MKRTIPIADIKLGEEEIKSALEVLESGNLRQGKKTKEFEQLFAQKVGAKYAIAVSSGTAALHMAYLSVLNPGEEVLVPSFTFIATASMVEYANCKPIFCDVDLETFTISIDDIKKKITKKTKAIVPVHLFGNACYMDDIINFAQENKLRIIWDAAQAHGTIYRGKDVGSFDDIVCYSFYPTKNMITGEGGMITTNSPEIYKRIKALRSHGQEKKYYHTSLGLNYRMTDVEAAIGTEQLKKLDDMLKSRRKNAQLLDKELKKVKGITPQLKTPHSKHSFHQYCVLVDPKLYGCERNELAEKLKQENIMTGIHYPRGIHQQPVFEKKYGKINLPNTLFLTQHILALPVHHRLSLANDIHRILDCLKSFAKGA